MKPVFAFLLGALAAGQVGASTAPTLRHEAVFSRPLGGATQPLRMEGRAYHHGRVLIDAAGYWTPRVANHDYNPLSTGQIGWGGMGPSAGMTSMWPASAWTSAVQPGLGWSMLNLAVASAWFNPVGAPSAFAGISPYSFDSTFQFLFGTVRETGGITRAADGVLSYSYTQTITLNGGLPAPVAQIPEAEGWVLLLAGIGVLAVGQRPRRRFTNHAEVRHGTTA